MNAATNPDWAQHLDDLDGAQKRTDEARAPLRAAEPAFDRPRLEVSVPDLHSDPDFRERLTFPPRTPEY